MNANAPYVGPAGSVVFDETTGTWQVAAATERQPVEAAS